MCPITPACQSTWLKIEVKFSFKLISLKLKQKYNDGIILCFNCKQKCQVSDTLVNYRPKLKRLLTINYFSESVYVETMICKVQLLLYKSLVEIEKMEYINQVWLNQFYSTSYVIWLYFWGVYIYKSKNRLYRSWV